MDRADELSGLHRPGPGERGTAMQGSRPAARLAREHAAKLISQGKTVKILTVGRKGHDILRRQYPNNIVDTFNFREIKQVGFTQAQQVADKVLEMFNAGAEFVGGEGSRIFLDVNFNSTADQTACSPDQRITETVEGDTGSGSLPVADCIDLTGAS